jgi:hypothetical protein
VLKHHAMSSLDLGTIRRWVLYFTLRSLYPRNKRWRTHWIGSWVGSRAGLDMVAKRIIPDPTGNRSPTVQPTDIAELQAILFPALDGDEWSASRCDRFTSEKRTPGTQWVGSWVGPRTGLDVVAKSSCLCRRSNHGPPARSHFSE